jgi:squalene-hopene/tetraprenyl-beta-curcumene cyclase
MSRKVISLSIAIVAFAAIAAKSNAQAPGVPAQEVAPVIDKAVAYLKSAQGADGSFSPKLAGPGVTAIVAAGLIKCGVSPEDPLVAKSLTFIESSVQKDGGIYSKGLANYTTAVAVMAFTEANKGGKYDAVIRNAEAFLKNIQYGDDDSKPTHGGFSYDGPKSKKGAPDMSNTGFSIDALVAAGISKDDPALQKALKFVSRSQNLAGEFNDQAYAKNATAEDVGGFTYNFSSSDGKYMTPNGGLRSLGAMTYTGLKSFLYAGVAKDDPRVKAAVGWVRRNYTLEENPGMGKAGLFYYYQTFGKAMTAWGDDQFKDDKGKAHDWRRELFTALRARQLADGAWQNAGDATFGERDKNLATGFALISLSYCKAR